MDIINITMYSDKESDSESESESDCDVMLELDEEDYIEIESCVYELVSDILSNNVLLYSDPNFHSNLIDDVIELYQNGTI